MAAKTKLTAPDVTLERLRSVLDYDPETGILRWGSGVNKFVKWKIGSLAGTDSNGYLSIVIDYRMYMAHRLAWFYVHGVWPDQIDHRDMNRRNNAIANLRLATFSQNNANRCVRGDCSSGYKGVRFHKPSKRWQARLAQRHLGLFSSPKEAHSAYIAAAIEKYGQYANAG